MTDRPILFSAPMVRAERAGRKTQTRRILKPQPPAWATFCQQLSSLNGKPLGLWQWCEPETSSPLALRRWPVHESGPLAGTDYGLRPPYAPGDRLWVREPYYQFGHWLPMSAKQTRKGRQKWQFIATSQEVLFEPPAGEPVRLGRHHKDPYTQAWHKRLARFMPRALSRTTLIVEAVRVERLQDISEADAEAEGAIRMVVDDDSRFYESKTGTFKCGFAGIWTHINGAGAWDANPWVVAITFRPIRANIDAIEAAP